MSVKAFDLVPATEISLSERVGTTIECLECCGKYLYVGIRDSFVIQYTLEEVHDGEGRTLFSYTKLRQRYLGYKKPVVQIKACSALDRVICLCDGNLVFTDMPDLEPQNYPSKVKSVSCFCLNENPGGNNPFVIELCVARKRQLQLYSLTEDKLSHIKDVTLPETALTIAMDGQYVCAALSSQYVIADCWNSFSQHLFPYESDLTTPLVKRITREEFLLSGPSGLGMFVTVAGISERPPLPWDSSVVAAAYTHPYILCLGTQHLTVYSILDQLPKQRLFFRGGRCMDNFEGKLLIAGSHMIYTLVPVPWEKQVQALLADRKVAEALELARYSNKGNVTETQFQKTFLRIQQQAGFIQFSLYLFEEAKELFLKGLLDVRELISIYPGLLPASSGFVRCIPPLHDIADVEQLCHNSPEKLEQCKIFLMNFLEEIQSKPGIGFKLEVDTALLKLYAELNTEKLITLVSSGDNGCDPVEGADYLFRHHHYHGLALFHKTRGDLEKALQIWSKLVAGEYTDSCFPGLQYLVKILACLQDHKLIWKYVDFVMERDQNLAIKIFTERPSDDPATEHMRPDVVIDFLHRYPVALVLFLEYLVFQRKLEKEKYHTHLAVLYLENILRLRKVQSIDPIKVTDARKKLQHLLYFSSTYRVQLLLGKALENNLHDECAILYGKLEEHEKALRILVHKLEDYSGAENYCLQLSEGKERKTRHRLFHTLLGVYLDPNLDEKHREELLAPAVQLLNSEEAEFDAVKVLQLIPEEWSVAIVDQFLNKALRTSLHRLCTTRIESALARGENLQTRFSKVHMEQDVVVLTDDRLCGVCKRPFTEASFAWYPNNIIIHPQCAKNSLVCPVTGNVFGCTDLKPR
ncbi:transforming growth factor-beta receptor-associated protein 1-like [Tachypleus tridentatus]|uniref:transforming growth factor-beta receptor-associated protein 1-like n=1 Tax=Tachypleus tridentatus TaxID=6853 RepID=UPI003FD3E118